MAAKKDTDNPAYGIKELQQETGLKPASIRVALRALGVEKADTGRYGWNTQKDFNAVLKMMKERSAAKPDMTKKADAEEKPAKKKAPAKRKPAAKKAAE